ncbi:TRAP transporter small permease subunit [Chloroflexota bacterium]
MAIFILAGVLARSTKQVLAGTTELSQLALVTIVFFGLAYTQSLDENIRTDVIYCRLKPEYQLIAKCVYTFCGFLIMGFITFCAWQFAYESWRTGEYEWSILRLPLWPPKMILFGGSLLITIQLAIEAGVNVVKLSRCQYT